MRGRKLFSIPNYYIASYLGITPVSLSRIKKKYGDANIIMIGVDGVKIILYLRDSGFNVDEIALALDMEDYLLLEHLERKRSEIEQVIQGEQDKLRKIAIAKDEMQDNKSELPSLAILFPYYRDNTDYGLYNGIWGFFKYQRCIYRLFQMVAKKQGYTHFSSCISHDVRHYTGFTNKILRRVLSVMGKW